MTKSSSISTSVIYQQFGVRNEEELAKALIEDWDKVKCTNCGKEISLLDAKFSYEMPVCRKGCDNG